MDNITTGNNKGCSRCGRCCQYFAINVGNPTAIGGDARKFLYVREWFFSRGYLVQFKPCRFLEANVNGTFKCRIYKDRPVVCRMYPQPADWRPEGCTHE